MKRLLLFSLLASLFGSHVLTAHITLLWQADRKIFWETDWVLELLTGLEYETVDDMKFEKFIDNSIIVVCAIQENMMPYFKKLHEMHYKFGIILLSDECYKCPTDFYQYAQFVFRNFWHKKFNDDPHVVCFPLGYKQGFWNNCSQRVIKEATQRKYCWSFAGQVGGKPTRTTMIDRMKRISPFYVHEIHTFADSRSLGTKEYRELLLESIFVPCGCGYWNIDSFRVCEALECGCIPIVETFPLDYFKKFFGNHPFLAVDSWDQAPELMKQLLTDPVALESKRLECMRWWDEYKKNLKKTFTEIIKNTIC